MHGMKNLLNKIENACRSRFSAAVALTVAIEAITLLFRFGLGLKSTQHTASTVGRLTFGIRVHHGYIGVLLLLLLLIPAIKRSRLADVLWVVGAAMFASDIIHHSILYFVTGSADLDLVYPGM
jgi:hypothetical protein